MEHASSTPDVEQHEHFLYKRVAPLCAPATPVVTVIVQCFNRTTFLDQTVASVREQTFPDFNLIVFDNGSSLEEAKQIEAIADRYQASYIHAFHNGHGDNIRRLALPLITTKYVAILHDDDMWMPTKLANAVEELEGKNLDYVFSNKQYIDTNGNLLPGVDFVNAAISDYNYAALKPEQVVEIGLFRSNILHWSSLVIRAEVLWREFAKYAFFYRIGDWMFFCHLVMSDNLKGSCIDNRDTLIRIHENNDFSYSKFSPIKRVAARTNLFSDEIHFFQEVLAYSEDKFVKVFEKYFQGKLENGHLNRCYVDLSFRISEWPSPSWIHFSKQCFLKAVELDPDDTHDYLLSRYRMYGDNYVSRLDTTFFVRNMGICLGFIPNWIINIIIRGVHWWKTFRADEGFLPAIGGKRVRKSQKIAPT